VEVGASGRRGAPGGDVDVDEVKVAGGDRLDGGGTVDVAGEGGDGVPPDRAADGEAAETRRGSRRAAIDPTQLHLFDCDSGDALPLDPVQLSRST
jgi:hypothetical protein